MCKTGWVALCLLSVCTFAFSKLSVYSLCIKQRVGHLTNMNKSCGGSITSSWIVIHSWAKKPNFYFNKRKEFFPSTCITRGVNLNAFAIWLYVCLADTKHGAHRPNGFHLFALKKSGQRGVEQVCHKRVRIYSRDI